ncbi:MAG: hypothetical protein E6I23_12390 [Chloroflexi bacterium]|nr:MAG: hypothetical protein E6I23_12390 [Chloroflexota bacterium]
MTNVVIDVVILLVLVAIAVSAARAWRVRPVRPNPLPAETRSRYVAAWERIEKRFMDAPEDAVQEADSLVTVMLGEQGHAVAGDRLPPRLREARREFARGQKRHRTEDLRRALLDYRAAFVHMIGPERAEPFAEGRRETA